MIGSGVTRNGQIEFTLEWLPCDLWRALLYDFKSGFDIADLAEAHGLTKRRAEDELRRAINWAESRKWKGVQI